MVYRAMDHDSVLFGDLELTLGNDFRVLLVHTYYPEFLDGLYSTDGSLTAKPFQEQQQVLLKTGFCLGDAYSHYLRSLGCHALDVIVNADPLQARWAFEHDLTLVENIHDRRRQILAAQVDHEKPDVLYVFEWCPLGDTFWRAMKSKVRILAGQVASPLHGNRSYEAYDIMFSSWPPIVDYFRAQGQAAQHLKLGFDPRSLENQPTLTQDIEVSFVGGFAPSHSDRIEWLEALLPHIPIDIFGYGLENVPENSLIRHHHQGPVWGHQMYETLRRSKVTLNRHAQIDVRGKVVTHLANNMRLFEATGAGTCLLTEHKENLSSLFEPDREVVTYENNEECVEKTRYLLDHETERMAIAQAGQQKTLRDHTYDRRMAELLEMLRTQL